MDPLKKLFRSPAQKAIAEGDAFRDARNWPAAAVAYGRAVELDPSRADIWVQYGHALKESGQLERAGAAYRRALACNDRVADTHLQLGHLLKISGNPAAAAESYLRALELDPHLADALREIRALGARGIQVPADRLDAAINRAIRPAMISSVENRAMSDAAIEELADVLERLKQKGANAEDMASFADAAARIRALTQKASASEAANSTWAGLVFDASDLIHHFRHSRLLTGIQRVQLEIIASVIRTQPEPVRICALFEGRWVQIPTSLFMMLADLSKATGEMGTAEWRAATTRLEILLGSASAFRFPLGACLVNLGTSWHVDYLLQVRNAKRDYRIRYIPFVHDLIPIVASQFVLPSLTEDFVAWLLAVFDHADMFLTNSCSTRRDLCEAARRLGHELREEDVVVVPLDARFTPPDDETGAGHAFLRRRGLLGQPFVLFVATVEPRKNHMAAINAWAELLPRLGPKMPKLVCVGGRGWMNEEVFNRISSNHALARHVLFFHDLSDVELSACYDACLFTLFPSHYEGWGLPVTESLCRGKVPLLSDTSSLPEAGGAFAVYFPHGSQPELVKALERLIVDADHRAALEKNIAEGFRPRAWADLGLQIASAVSGRFAATDAQAICTGALRLRPGFFYSLARNGMRRLKPGLISGEALRIGHGWHTPEPWGCWGRGMTVELGFRFPETGAYRVYVGVRGMPERPCTLSIAVDGTEELETLLRASESKWLPILIEAKADVPVELEIHSDTTQDLAAVTNGNDRRMVGPGLLGVYACARDDAGSRLAFIEALATGMLEPGPLAKHEPAPPSVEVVEATETVEAIEPALPLPGTLTFLDEKSMIPNATRDEIILMQSSDAEIYAVMLEQSARTTRLYCRIHGYRYEAFIGIKRGCLPWHASYNRIDMLMDLIRQDYQGWVFYLDADAWIADLDFDLKAYLATKKRYALIGMPAGHLRDHYWNINNGILLFNLGHPFTRAFIAEWERFLSRYDLARDAKQWNVEIPDDQGMFHQILDKLPYAADLILIEDKDHAVSPWVTAVRHALRAEHSNFAERVALIAREVDKVVADLAAA